MYTDAYIQEVLKYGQDWDVILTAEQLESWNPFVLILCADLYIARGDIDTAISYIERAKENLCYANEREQLFVAAFDSWISGFPERALAQFCKIVQNHPNDLFAIKRAQLVAFLLGDAKKILSIVESPAVIDTCSRGRRAFFHGMLGFALEQNGRLREAEAAGRLGSEINPEDPWAHHAVAHALYFQGRYKDGISWLLSHKKHWEGCMSFMYTHNYFHLALNYLATNQFEEFEKVFDECIWRLSLEEKKLDGHHFFPKMDKSYFQDQLGALGILWKYELRGGSNMNDRWEGILADVPVPSSHIDPLLDLCIILGLSRTGHKVKQQEMLSSMIECANNYPSPTRKHDLETVWINYAKGIIQAYEGEYTKAADLLSVAIPSVHIVGGSAEQREVLSEFYVDVLKKAGRIEEAETYAKENGITCV